MNGYEQLNERQQEGVFTTEGPVLILAGAGSGKTGVITHRIAHLIEDNGVNPYNILAITFTNKAAKEMRERVDSLVGIGADAAWIMTFHAACVRILRRYIDRLGYANNFTIYDTDDQKNIIKDICKRMNIDTKQYKEKTILSKISSAKDNLTGPDEMYQTSGNNYISMKIADIYRAYQEQLKKNNALDFDDIICLTVKLFEEDAEVLEYYRKRFRYIMVDEYQDTNTAQFSLIKLLAGADGNLCVVGDDDQSIYKFRGANIMNILNFEEYFNNVRVIKLEQNYRSTQNILDAANAVISNNSGRKAKKLWTAGADGEKVIYNIYENGYEEASGIADDILTGIREGGEYNDYAVLYRTNAQSRALEEKLLEKNIPYKIYGGINFYSRKEIKDILAYLKTIDNAMDDLAVKRVINVPKRGIGATTMERISLYAAKKDITFYEALKYAGETGITRNASEKIKSFVILIEALRAKSGFMAVDRLIREIIECTGYYEYLDNEAATDEEAAERKDNIEELISKAVLYSENTENPQLGGFLEEVALVADIDSLDETDNRVSLMTIHSAKGLEFPVVFLAGMEEGLFPGYMSISTGDESDIEEERRLCYVGITRAKRQLILTAARLRMLHGEMRMNRTSRFVREIPDEYLEENAHQGKRRVTLSEDDHMKLPPRKAGQPVFSSFQKDAMKSGVFDKKTTGINGGTPGYDVGDRVKHVKFNEGTVLEIKDGGRDYEVTVNFDGAGVRKMFASFANLIKI